MDSWISASFSANSARSTVSTWMFCSLWISTTGPWSRQPALDLRKKIAAVALPSIAISNNLFATSDMRLARPFSRACLYSTAAGYERYW